MVGVVDERAGLDLAGGEGVLEGGQDQVGVRAGGVIDVSRYGAAWMRPGTVWAALPGLLGTISIPFRRAQAAPFTLTFRPEEAQLATASCCGSAAAGSEAAAAV
ncbi:hypothetical protein [Streptomyces mirabilis]|uniref:PilZ domain-containing protein n=1 Tax=Streptomyces mirabilis TaxID=68239 RepID=A0ABU3V1B5_9ACTN|nr:hypothetical protein [Streptomyces mirabilis]MCX4614698.1 hypothetical protein [Streptomyces mirabilis]MCX5346627.1 hypothetical protein [Streptomyces mirabilis]MDU8999971.1 hypothetical protein [Streptomyces mirabilis]